MIGIEPKIQRSNSGQFSRISDPDTAVLVNWGGELKYEPNKGNAALLGGNIRPL